ncbi:MAG: methylated-DNA--[protein]-cysteine S-methyltransferase [Tissierellia bacterium]|nr:methylated-DNA--[protein]-cysteine S-methyltransferase [Tissierellia bacterium]
MKYAYYTTKLGIIEISYDNSIESLRVVENINHKDSRNHITDKAYIEILEYLYYKRKIFDINYDLKVTDFQRKVLSEVSKIEYGHTKTYKEISRSIGNEKASRAVANAISKNPLWIVIPCHRVIGSDGKLRGYAGGLPMKKFLLDLEKNATL